VNATESRRLCRGLAAAGAGAWLLWHTLIYLVLLVAGLAVLEGGGWFRVDVLAGAADAALLLAWGILPLVLVPVTVGLLALVRTGQDLPWYWFRLVTLLLLNLPDLVLLRSDALGAFAAVNSILALLVVQPHWRLDD
jgi:hypothetical protein